MSSKQLLFSNGYNLALDGSVVDAKAIAPATDPDPTRTTATPGLLANSLQQGPTPTPPPMPQVGPPKGPFIAAFIGITVVSVVSGILFAHHRHEQARDFDTGFQFEIVLQAPLTLDRARVASALNGSSGN